MARHLLRNGLSFASVVAVARSYSSTSKYFAPDMPIQSAPHLLILHIVEAALNLQTFLVPLMAF